MNPSLTPEKNKISSGQKEQAVRVITNAVSKATETAIANLDSSGIRAQSFQRVLKRGDKVSAAVTEVIRHMFDDFVDHIRGNFKLISGTEVLFLDRTWGKMTLAREGSLFSQCRHAGLEKLGTDVPGKPTEASEMQVYDMTSRGKDFRGLYRTLGVGLDALCLEQEQIIQFLKHHRKWVVGAPKGGTFFLFKVGTAFLVIGVAASNEGLVVQAFKVSEFPLFLEGQRFWFVVPKLKSLTS